MAVLSDRNHGIPGSHAPRQKVRHAKTRAALASVRIREGDAAWVVLVERHARTLANLGAMQADRDYLLARVRELEAKP